MSDARDFTADLLAGRRSHIDDRAPRSPGAPGSTEQILNRTRESIETLERLRAANPQEALDEFRGLLADATLTAEQLDEFLNVWRLAVDDPQTFHDEVRKAPTRGVRSWWDALRAYLHRPVQPDEYERELLESLSKRYVFPQQAGAPPVNPHERLFETLDPGWVPLAKAKFDERYWPAGLADMPRHSAARPFVYEAVGADGKSLAAKQAHEVALLSDFGSGYYHSWGIAQQLASWALPYTFHLGDVYYGGTEQEFLNGFELPLFDVVEKTRLLGLPENHELYADGGRPYLDFFKRLRERGRTPQEGSYFCVRFPHHQVIGLDVNWQGRQRCRDELLLGWLRDRVAEADGRTNILLTGSAPFVHGSAEPKPLLQDLWSVVGSGAIALWFWGDDHYCALFDRRLPYVPFYGSCIGHGGYPGARQERERDTYTTEPLWLEKLARFPEWTKLRTDMTNNGWCHATLRPDGGVDLVYVDWLSCKRAAVSFERKGDTLFAGKVEEFDRDSDPQIHRPR